MPNLTPGSNLTDVLIFLRTIHLDDGYSRGYLEGNIVTTDGSRSEPYCEWDIDKPLTLQSYDTKSRLQSLFDNK